MSNKTYKTTIPEITLKYKSGDILKTKITSSHDAYEVLKKMYDMDTLELTESFICIFLNRANNTIGWMKISSGGISGTVADPKIILGTALKSGASSILLSHNHPSGNMSPSQADRDLTKKIVGGANFMDIQVLDHIIMSGDATTYYSFMDEGWL